LRETNIGRIYSMRDRREAAVEGSACTRSLGRKNCGLSLLLTTRHRIRP